MANKTRELFQLERLAFFSDAVFAIAITLLVVEVRLPEIATFTDADVRAALITLLPKYGGFLLSFLVIGRFWVGHHRVFGHLKTSDAGLIWRNLAFLMTIAFMPFPTTVISEYGSLNSAFTFYVVWLILAGVLFHLFAAYAMRTPALCFDHDDRVAREAIVYNSWAPVIIGVLALIVGQFDTTFALISLLAAPLITWAVRTIGRRRTARSGPGPGSGATTGGP